MFKITYIIYSFVVYVMKKISNNLYINEINIILNKSVFY